MSITPACLALAVAASSLLLGASASAQSEFMGYVCDAEVTGSIAVTAHVDAGPAGTINAFDVASVAGLYTPPALGELFYFAYEDGASVGFSRGFTAEGCPTTVKTAVSGDAGYSCRATPSGITYEAYSVHHHESQIAHSPLSAGPGVPVSIDTSAFTPVSDPIIATIPFFVGGGNGATLDVTQFSLYRNDSGPTTGSTSAKWELFADANGNCVIDPFEVSLGSDRMTIGPNGFDSTTGPGMAVPRGYYILQLTFVSESDMTIDSEGCGDPAHEESHVLDGVYFEFTLN